MDHPCVLCDRYFGSKQAFEQHQRDSPVHKNAFHCETCSCSFGSKQALEQHQRDSPVHKKTFHCENCNCSFGSGKALASHRSNCQVVQESSEDHLETSIGRNHDVDALSKALASCSIVDMPALALQRYAQKFVSANPVTTTTPQKRAKKNISKTVQETREFFMFPELHADISKAVFPEITSTWFNENDDDDQSNHEYPTYVMGRFVCNNNACKKQLWVSGKVFIEIRGYDGNGYSAVVYNQRCKSCNSLGTFVLGEQSYIDRVAYRLKYWAGVREKRPYHGEATGPPHERDFCEGCRRGKCHG